MPASAPWGRQTWEFGESGLLRQSAQRTNNLLAQEANRKSLATTRVRTNSFFQVPLCPGRPPVTNTVNIPRLMCQKLAGAFASLHTVADDASVVGVFGHRVRL